MSSIITVLMMAMSASGMAGFMPGQEANDPYLWLESVQGEKALAWVRVQNDSTLAALTPGAQFRDLYDRTLSVYNAVDRIAYPEVHGKLIYNFWKDERHERGLWRRTTVTEYLHGKPVWETVLDIDSLSRTEGESWVFAGADFLRPQCELCMLYLSRGGADASVAREFDLRTRRFVDGGFVLPESKGGTSWKDRNTLLVSSGFTRDEVTTSGYPRVVKIWKRGTSFESAQPFFGGDSADMGSWVFSLYTAERQYVLVTQGLTMFTRTMFAVEDTGLVRLDIPRDADFMTILRNQVIVWLKTDWHVGNSTYVQGSLVGVDYDGLLRGLRIVHRIWAPDGKSCLNSVSSTRNLLLLSTLNNVRGELSECAFQGGAWAARKVNAPEFGAITVVDADPDTDRYFFAFTNFLTPYTLFWVDPEKGVQKVKSQPAYFDATLYEVRQYETPSKDGTSIPYFLVARKDLSPTGQTPTILRGYGGFEVPYTPEYLPADGYAWLDRGGAIAVANIRGGGEFGPQWHLGAMRENRQKVYDDFYAVARDLIARKITSPEHLGIIGGSNGGLLVGVAFTQRPDLFHAVVCLKPLLDMRRYNKLLAGASWMDEYGDPDKPEDWAFISKYSPYHNVAAGRDYPRVLFVTSTRDDRVHPAHARKMAAKMEDMGYKVYFYENVEGGHAVSSTNKEKAYVDALCYTYFLKMLR